MSINVYPSTQSFSLTYDAGGDASLPSGGTLTAGAWNYTSNCPIAIGDDTYPAGSGIITISTNTSPSFVTMGARSIIANGVSFTSTSFTNLQYVNNLFFASASISSGQNGILATSTDGTTWSTRTANAQAGFGTWNAGAFGNSTYVLVGNGGQLRTSTDAVTWTSRASVWSTSANFGVAYGSSKFAMIGDNLYATSTDGITWTTRPSPIAGQQRKLEFLNNLFLVGGQSNSAVSTSTDGITWTARTIRVNSGLNIRRFTYGKGLYTVITSNNDIRTSTDAVTWNLAQPANFTTTQGKNSIAFGGGVFISVGQDPAGFEISTNGNAYVPFAGGPSAGVNLNNIAFGNNTFVAEGGNVATIYQATKTPVKLVANFERINSNGTITAS
jgi:hypothetical protein